MQERAMEIIDETEPLPKVLALSGGKGVRRDKLINSLNSLITEVWNEAVEETKIKNKETIEYYQIRARNEAIKECESKVLSLERWESTDGGEAGMRAEDHGGYIDREQTLQAISKMRV